MKKACFITEKVRFLYLSCKLNSEKEEAQKCEGKVKEFQKCVGEKEKAQRCVV